MVKKKSVSKSTKKPTARALRTTTFPRKWIIVAVVALLTIFLLSQKPGLSPTTNPSSAQPVTFDFANQKLKLDNQELTFMNGMYKSSDATYGEHTATIVNRSVNPSGTRAAAILVDSPGGSGTFYYVVGSMLKNGKETYSTPVSLGDRVKIVSVKVDDPSAQDNGMITVDYLDRTEGAAMATEPTEKKTATYAFQDDGNLIVVLH